MKVELEEYNHLWKNIFENEKKIIAKSLNSLEVNIEHIGSTSIENLSAKPVIDILIGVKNESNLDSLPEPLICAGYIYVKKYEDVLPERRYFIKVKNSSNEKLPSVLISYNDNINRIKFPHLFHIHSVVLNGNLWRKYIGFRDFLRNNSEERKKYQKLKMNLAGKDWNSINDYTDAKTEFVKSIEAKAGII